MNLDQQRKQFLDSLSKEQLRAWQDLAESEASEEGVCGPILFFMILTSVGVAVAMLIRFFL